MNYKFLESEHMSAIQRARELYSHDAEKYHTIYHMNYMLALASRYWKELNEIHEGIFSEEDKSAVIMAIIFHDCIYEPGSDTNEEDSADEADAFLRTMNYDIKFRTKVTELILSTKIGCELKDDLQKFIHDLDWNCLITYEELVDSENKIFKEYRDGGFLLLDIHRGRLKFYYEIDKQEEIFFSVFKKYNSVAKSNISKRIIEYKYSI